MHSLDLRLLLNIYAWRVFVTDSSIRFPRLLVIDNDSDVRKVVLSVAEMSHMQIEIADDAWAAIDRLEAAKSAFDLLIINLSKGSSDGPLVLRALRRLLARRHGQPSGNITKAVVEAWLAHDGHGDLSELELTVKQYLLAEDKESKGDEHVSGSREKAQMSTLNEESSPEWAGTLSRRPCEGLCGHKSLRSFLQSIKEEAERNAITSALEETGWNRKAAARLLKTSYRSVLYKIEQYKISSPSRSAIDEPPRELDNSLNEQ